MSCYLVNHYKSVYRILPVINNATNDFCRDCNGKIDEDNVYIPCYYNSRIWHYGRSKLIAYIPSVQRGHNVIKALKKNGVNVFDCDESDEEVVFKFNASDMDQVASLMKPKTSGAKTSPFSSKNLPKAQVDIPENELARYKNLVSKLGTSGMSVIRTVNKNFLDELLAKKLRQKYAKKPFDYKSDMRAMCLSRDTKSYIYAKGLWEDYLKFLEIAIDTYLNK